MGTRRERVIVDADDRYSSKVDRMGAATGAFRAAMGDAEKQSKPFQRALAQSATESDRLKRSVAQTGSEIDRLSGRMRIWLDLAVLIGPAFLPIAAVAVPAVMGLANAVGAAALGAGAIAAALPGVADTVKALGEFRDDPSAANAEKLQEAFAKIGPDAAAFAVALDQQALPALRRMRDQAAAGGLDWLTAAIGQLEDVEPRISRVLRVLADATGEEIFDAANSFDSERWEDFYTFLETEMPGAISDVASATGNLTHGLTEMWEAFAPVNDDFGTWMVDKTADFDAWAERLESTQGFDDFVDFLEETGPKVEDFAGSFVNAAVQVGDAVEPFAGPTLTVLTNLLDVVGDVADSDLGAPLFGLAAGLAAVNRTMAIANSISGRAGGAGVLGMVAGGNAGSVRQMASDLRAATPTLAQFGTVAYRAGQSSKYASEQTLAARAAVGKFGSQTAAALKPVAGPLAGIAVLSSGVADGLGMTNAASLALIGTMGGPWGAAAGYAAGTMLDLASANDHARESVERVERAMVGGLAAGRGQLAEEAKALESYRKGFEETWSGDWWKNTVSLKGAKNRVEGWFGDSDVEERGAAYEDAARQVQAMETAVRGLAAQMRTPITGTAEQQLTKLDQVLASAEPAMTKLGISTEEYVQLANMAGGVNPLGRLSPMLMAKAQADLAKMNRDLADTTQQMDSVAGRTSRVGDAFAAMGDDALPAAAKAQLVGQALSELIDPALNAVTATDAFYASLKQLRDADLSEGFEGQNAAVRENRALMNQSVQALQQRITAEIAAGGSGMKIANMLERGRAALIENARAAGVSEEKTRAYLRTLNLTPRAVITAIRQSDMTGAQKRARILRVLYQQLPKDVRTKVKADTNLANKSIKQINEDYKGLSKKDRRIVIQVRNEARKGIKNIDAEANLLEQKKRQVVFTARDQTKAVRDAIDAWQPNDKSFTTYNNVVTRKAEALGGFEPSYQPMAAGGYQPQMLGAGPTLYMWREPETQGESFIPHANDHRRPRAREIAEQTVSLFGGSVVWNALGGMYGQGRMQPITVNAGSSAARLTGTAIVDLRTPWGSQEVEVQMREIARDELDADSRFRYDHRQG